MLPPFLDRDKVSLQHRPVEHVDVFALNCPSFARSTECGVDDVSPTEGDVFIAVEYRAIEMVERTAYDRLVVSAQRIEFGLSIGFHLVTLPECCMGALHSAPDYPFVAPRC